MAGSNLNWHQVRADFGDANSAMKNAQSGFSQAGTVFGQLRKSILDEEQRAIDNAYREQAFNENVRQFGLKHALDRDRYAEAIREFNLGYDLNEKKFAFEQDKFTQEHALNKERLAKATEQFYLGYSLDQAKHALERQKVENQINQYNQTRQDLQNLGMALQPVPGMSKEEYESKVAAYDKANAGLNAYIDGYTKDKKALEAAQVQLQKDKDNLARMTSPNYVSQQSDRLSAISKEEAELESRLENIYKEAGKIRLTRASDRIPGLKPRTAIDKELEYDRFIEQSDAANINKRLEELRNERKSIQEFNPSVMMENIERRQRALNDRAFELREQEQIVAPMQAQLQAGRPVYQQGRPSPVQGGEILSTILTHAPSIDALRTGATLIDNINTRSSQRIEAARKEAINNATALTHSFVYADREQQIQILGQVAEEAKTDASYASLYNILESYFSKPNKNLNDVGDLVNTVRGLFGDKDAVKALNDSTTQRRELALKQAEAFKKTVDEEKARWEKLYDSDEYNREQLNSIEGVANNIQKDAASVFGDEVVVHRDKLVKAIRNKTGTVNNWFWFNEGDKSLINYSGIGLPSDMGFGQLSPDLWKHLTDPDTLRSFITTKTGKPISSETFKKLQQKLTKGY